MAEVVFSHTATYPDEPPLMKARSLRGMSDGDVAILQSILDGQVEENLGMPMVYQLITAAQEWITEKGIAMAQPVLDPLAEEKKRRAAEEERIAELRAKSSIQESTTAAAAVKGKMTGKAWFLQQEAQHIDIEEPELSDEEHEEDGEGSRSDWSGEDRTDYFGKQLIEGDSEYDEDLLDDDDDDEDFLDEYLNTEGDGDGAEK
jgi:RWD domain